MLTTTIPVNENQRGFEAGQRNGDRRQRGTPEMQFRAAGFDPSPKRSHGHARSAGGSYECRQDGGEITHSAQITTILIFQKKGTGHAFHH